MEANRGKPFEVLLSEACDTHAGCWCTQRHTQAQELIGSTNVWLIVLEAQDQDTVRFFFDEDQLSGSQ